MKEETPSEDSFCRLSRAIIEKNRCTYAEALGILEGLRLNLVCDEKIRASVALQAALVTAINAGKRSFLGGVSVWMRPDVANLLPGPTAGSLNDLAAELGAAIAETPCSPAEHTLYLGAA